MAASRVNSSWRTCRRYKYFFYVCTVVLFLQFYLGYRFYSINQEELNRIKEWKHEVEKRIQVTELHAPDVEKVTNVPIVGKPASFKGEIHQLTSHFSPVDLSQPQTCIIQAAEALSALKRAKTEDCKQRLMTVTCLNQDRKLYPLSLPRFCPLKGKHTKGTYMGCFKDTIKNRDLKYNTQFPEFNTPQTCIDYCLTGSFAYAGVQYKTECWCGDEYGKHSRLLESSCASPCPGNITETCGGFNAQRIFSTGLPVKVAKPDGVVINPASVKGMAMARIVFVLTVNGKAVRQVKRLIKTLYQRQHYFYIHVDSRSNYMYSELLKLEDILPNVRLARERFATIWGGASLLQAHLSFMRALLGMTDWTWDYYLNLSESDYPLKDIDAITMYFTMYKGNNFVKSNGREIPKFIKKQGMDQTFYECDTHLWRLGKRELPTDIRFDGGSDWVALYKDFCEYSVSNQDMLVTGLKRFYQFSLLPVESFFHTLLTNSAFCEKWVDNNLHLTNWKRKQGCQCQHKDLVDWCGCSPNDLKPLDFSRIMGYSMKPKYFARKFEAIVSQEILNQIDAMLGMDIKEIPSFNHYWENVYHYTDHRNKKTDITLSLAESLIRRTEGAFITDNDKCVFNNIQILEAHVLYVSDIFQRYLIKFNVSIEGRGVPVTLEAEFPHKHFYRVADPSGPTGRLQFLEVNTDWDVKELMFRNYAQVLGPHSDVVLRHVWGHGTPLIVAVVWIDPAGTLASYQDITVPQDPTIEVHKPKLKTPLRPGEWTVKVIFQGKVRAEVKFTVLPYLVYDGEKMTLDEVQKYHNGPEGQYFVGDMSLFASKYTVQNSEELLKEANVYGQKTDRELEDWIDDLTAKVWPIEDTCSIDYFSEHCPTLDRCHQTKWSSMSPDPKSEIKKKIML